MYCNQLLAHHRSSIVGKYTLSSSPIGTHTYSIRKIAYAFKKCVQLILFPGKGPKQKSLYCSPGDILLVWFNANQCAEYITDQLDGLDGEVLYDQVIEQD